MTEPNRGSSTVSPRAAAPAPGYPQAPADPSRRRFLRQVAVGAGAVTVASGVGVARAQTGPAADFSVLEEHVPTETPEPPAPLARRRARSDAPRREAEGTGEVAGASEEWITENRALWVEPGYLVLLQWHRPSDDEAPVAALEGAAEAVGTYLGGAVTDAPTQLHDADQLGVLEEGVAAVLAPFIAPAAIDVLHLDHDCSVLCPTPEPESPHVRGRVAAPRR